MNRYKSEANEALVDTAPLFASVWLALFSILRENYLGHRFASTGESEDNRLKNNR